jgi:hypothetical protein
MAFLLLHSQVCKKVQGWVAKKIQIIQNDNENKAEKQNFL